MTGNIVLSPDNPALNTVILNRKTDILSTEVDDETVILDMDSGKYRGLDDIGTFIWQQLAHDISFGNLCTNLMKRYDVDEKICRHDTLNLLWELEQLKLISIKSS
jgi:hypothetical protein